MTARLWDWFVFLCVLGLASPVLAQPAPAAASNVQLRPVDRATVRIVTLVGITAATGTGDRTGLTRMFADVTWGFGSGVIVDRSGLVLTARHVIEGADFVAVLHAESDDATPARVVFVDPDHDIAFLRVSGAVPAYLSLPRAAHVLQPGERLSATGYPLDVDERTPAAAAGELSRVTNEGLIQAAMSLNPGNSGGPVVDERGRLAGIVAARGSPEAGVQGIAYLEPLSAILDARAAAGNVSEEPDATDAAIASELLFLLRGRNDAARAGATLQLEGRVRNPEEAAIVAASAWNILVVMLEDHGARDVGQLPADVRPTGIALNQTCLRLSQSVVRRAPYMSRLYTFVSVLTRNQARPFVAAGRPGGAG